MNPHKKETRPINQSTVYSWGSHHLFKQHIIANQPLLETMASVAPSNRVLHKKQAPWILSIDRERCEVFCVIWVCILYETKRVGFLLGFPVQPPQQGTDTLLRTGTTCAQRFHSRHRWEMISGTQANEKGSLPQLLMRSSNLVKTPKTRIGCNQADVCYWSFFHAYVVMSYGILILTSIIHLVQSLCCAPF